MRNQLLLIEDVDDLGRSGEIVSVKPGYSRNFLLPQKKAVVADKFTLRMQAKLKDERAKKAEVDRQEAEALSKKIDGRVLLVEVKVNQDGHMYGSVTTSDVARLFENEGTHIDRRSVMLAAPIKALGVYPVSLKLKEGVPAHITLKIVGEGYVPPVEEVVEAPPQE